MIKQRGNRTLHLLDRYIGIPTVAALGHLRRRRSLPTQFETIGILRTVAIGDTVLLSGVVADLALAFPRASLVFFAGPSNFEVAKMLPGIDRVVMVSVGNPAAGIRAVRSVPVDVMLDFGQWPRLEALFTLFSRASCTVGFETARQYRHYGYDRTVEHSSEVHEIENFRRLAKVLGAATGSAPVLRSPPGVTVAADDYAVFHMWPGGMRRKAKQWPRERWIQLIEEFADWGMKVVLTGAAADHAGNQDVINRTSGEDRREVRNAAGLSLEESAAVLAASRLVVSVDTGVMHLAAALGTPVVALHGPSSSRRWGPIGKNAVAIDSPVPGCGYVSLGWESVTPAPACMEGIGYETVRDRCREALEKSGSLQLSRGH